jgi:hypothetical protein
LYCNGWLTIVVGNWSIGSDSGKAIAATLQRNTTLTSLNLSCMLCECLFFCALTVCDVDTKIGDDDAVSIAAALASNTTLKSINLRGIYDERLIVQR